MKTIVLEGGNEYTMRPEKVEAGCVEVCLTTCYGPEEKRETERMNNTVIMWSGRFCYVGVPMRICGLSMCKPFAIRAIA